MYILEINMFDKTYLIKKNTEEEHSSTIKMEILYSLKKKSTHNIFDIYFC